MLPWIVENSQNLRCIKTARTLDAINIAAESGFFPLVLVVKPNPQITSKFAIFQHKENKTNQSKSIQYSHTTPLLDSQTNSLKIIKIPPDQKCFPNNVLIWDKTPITTITTTIPIIAHHKIMVWRNLAMKARI